jgi:tetratricopeptide (TPR) repeat protein
MPFFQANYLEYDLRLVDGDRLQVLDWTDYGWGHRFSDWIGLEMISQQPNENAARKLVDFPSVQQAQVFQMMEILKSTRDMKLDRYWQIVDTMDEAMRRQRVVWKLGLDATRKARKRRDQRKVLEGIDKYYPQDVLFALPLLDYYFPAQQYDKAYEALVRVRDKLRVDDALTNARLSSAELVLNRVDEAIASAEKATEQEADLELGWWSLFRAQVAAGDHASAIVALETLSGTFGHELDATTLSKDPSLREFVASDEFREWQEGSGGSN